MSPLELGARTVLGKLRLRLKDKIVSDVPSELSLCEFDCRKIRCLLHEWEHCENRLSYLALEAHSDGDISESGDGLPELIKAA